jgi:hypothetical protein
MITKLKALAIIIALAVIANLAVFAGIALVIAGNRL